MMQKVTFCYDLKYLHNDYAPLAVGDYCDINENMYSDCKDTGY